MVMQGYKAQYPGQAYTLSRDLVNLKIHVAFWELGIRCTIRRNDGKFSIQTISSNYYGEREDR